MIRFIDFYQLLIRSPKASDGRLSALPDEQRNAKGKPSLLRECSSAFAFVCDARAGLLFGAEAAVWERKIIPDRIA
jgi:hypothetical protein